MKILIDNRNTTHRDTKNIKITKSAKYNTTRFVDITTDKRQPPITVHIDSLIGALQAFKNNQT